MKFAALISCFFVFPFAVAGAQEQPQPQRRFASVHQITGSVQASDAAGQRARELKLGDVVYVGERVHASATGEAVLRTDDAGVIAVRPNAAFVMDQFIAKGNAQDALSVRILTGALRMITGWTGYFNKQQYRIVTPSATVGIRGTDHETYVLSNDRSLAAQMPEGTYNKVNSGGTTIETNGVQLDVTVGQVGFAPADPEMSLSALSTVLMPTLLEKVPGFFVPGAFDQGLEALAAQDMAAAIKAGKVPPAAQGETDAPAAAASPSAATTAPASAPLESGACKPIAIATQWLKELDTAISQNNPANFIAKFDAEVRVLARVRDGTGKQVEVGFSRDELAKSTFASLANLSGYTARRPVITASISAQSSAAQCDRIEVESIVIESGVRNAGSYRTESLENYTLLKRGGMWVATRASTGMR